MSVESLLQVLRIGVAWSISVVTGVAVVATARILPVTLSSSAIWYMMLLLAVVVGLRGVEPP